MGRLDDGALGRRIRARRREVGRRAGREEAAARRPEGAKHGHQAAAEPGQAETCELALRLAPDLARGLCGGAPPDPPAPRGPRE
ncbi:hypothetical protein Maq22A_c05390 [Methylobacterium aquaticum]|uniref:Uncharacterized protein n=1 Tax=Methylobacterium aquaticum TaxID=270351 RepID=A0A0C6F7Y3_9HYPH|nr:hypothetical protein Maq22A_c05390 [Methylobacterium aquaticum]